MGHSLASAAAALGALGLVAAACNGGDGGAGPSSCTGKCDGVIAHPAVVTCTRDGSDVVCASALPADFPLSADVSIYSFDGQHGATLSKGETLRVPVGTQVMAMVSLGSAQAGLFHADGDSDALDSFNYTFTTTGDRTLELPYDIWTVRLDAGDAYFINGKLAAQTLSLGTWETFLHNQSEVTRTGAPLPAVEKSVGSFFVIVGRDAKSVAGTAEICDEDGCAKDVALVFEGGGDYVIQSRAVGKKGSVAEPPKDNPDLGESPEPTPDLLPPAANDPDPSCGGEDQNRCNVGGDYVCDDHFVYTSSDNHCHACGKEDLLRCNVSGDYVCDDHFVYSSSDNHCHACGKEDQLRCNVNGDYVCDDHFVYSSNDNHCHACGKEGQLRCNVNGDYVCDAHFVYSSNDNHCHACGKEAEPRCLVDGNWVCDDGFAPGADYRCHAQ